MTHMHKCKGKLSLKIWLCCLISSGFAMGCHQISAAPKKIDEKSKQVPVKAMPVGQSGSAISNKVNSATGSTNGNTAGNTTSNAAIKASKMVFVKATCWGCHPHGGNSMNGDKPLKGPGFVKKYKSDIELAAVIRRGNEKMGMPPFPPEKLTDSDLKQVIVFVRSLSTAGETR